MEVFTHVSRNMVYPNGYLLELNRHGDFNDASFFGIIGNMVDKAFLEHLRVMFTQGISKHGADYLVNRLRHEVHFASWALEMCFEYERYKNHTNLPSRFQSAFAWQSLSDAQRFSVECGGGGIYAVEPLGQVVIADMSLLQFEKGGWENTAKNAADYWSGKEPRENHIPRYEVVTKCPVKIIERVS